MTNTIEYQMGAVQRQLVGRSPHGPRRCAGTRSRRRWPPRPWSCPPARGLVHGGYRPVHGAAAADAAGRRAWGSAVQLPETVRRLSENDGEDVPLEVQPIDVDSSDEIGEVARAFDQVHQQARRLAANEAALAGTSTRCS